MTAIGGGADQLQLRTKAVEDAPVLVSCEGTATTWQSRETVTVGTRAEDFPIELPARAAVATIAEAVAVTMTAVMMTVTKAAWRDIVFTPFRPLLMGRSYG